MNTKKMSSSCKELLKYWSSVSKSQPWTRDCWFSPLTTDRNWRFICKRCSPRSTSVRIRIISDTTQIIRIASFIYHPRTGLSISKRLSSWSHSDILWKINWECNEEKSCVTNLVFDQGLLCHKRSSSQPRDKRDRYIGKSDGWRRKMELKSSR
jgi:hypothetical protein